MPKDDTRAKQRLTAVDAQQFELPFVEESAPKFDLTKLHDLVLFSQNLLRETDCAALASTVTIRWNSRMQTTAGTACFARTQVTLNPKLMQFGAAEIEKTLRHELAHLLAKHRAGRKRIAPHGAEWKQACIDLGLRNERRCHDLPLARRKIERKHFYRCPSCRIEIKRVKPFHRAVACLLCCRKFNRGRFHEQYQLQKMRRI